MPVRVEDIDGTFGFSSRWRLYFRERFPLPLQAPVIAVFSSSVFVYASAIRSHSGRPSLTAVAAAFVVVLLTFLLSQCFDGVFTYVGVVTFGFRGDDVYLSTIETGKDVPPLCNTRWQLWVRPDSGPTRPPFSRLCVPNEHVECSLGRRLGTEFVREPREGRRSYVR